MLQKTLSVILAVAMLSLVAMPAMAGLEKKISLDFRDADIRDLIKIIADKAGTNIFVNKAVRGNVTIRCLDLPAREALDLLCKANGFAWMRTDNAILVADEKQLGTTQLQFHRFRHIDAGTAAKMVTQLVKRDLKLASARESGLLGLSGGPEALRQASLVCAAIDQPLPMVDACVQIFVGDDLIKECWLSARLGEHSQMNEKVVPSTAAKNQPATHFDLSFVPEYLAANGELVGVIDGNFSIALPNGEVSMQSVKQRFSAKREDTVLLADYGDPSKVGIYVTIDYKTPQKK